MRTYACVDRIEGKFAVCEVELVSIEQSFRLSCLEKDTVMIDIPLEQIYSKIENVEESDILVVELEDEIVTVVYGKDNKEKQRRIDALIAIMGG